MIYSQEDVLRYVEEEDVKFIRLAFCDVYGRQKNISVLADELPRAFCEGIAFDASAIAGFGDEADSDLFLHPDPDTLALLPWRPEHGKVVRMYCDITHPDGTPFECDTRAVLKKAVAAADEAGVSFLFGSEMEFYLFKLDDFGNATNVPYDNAGYMDIAPEDKGENIRRAICLTLEQMGICPESSHHEEGPGQNEIDFRYSDALSAAENALTFRNIVKTVASRNGVQADFSAKPIEGAPGNGFHINISVNEDGDNTVMDHVIAGLLAKTNEMTAFLNPTEQSYLRLGRSKAPSYISWSRGNRSQLVRIPAMPNGGLRAELRSPDPTANPYLAFALVIYAALYGIENKLELPPEENRNLYTADKKELIALERMPANLAVAKMTALDSDFIRSCLPEKLIKELLA